MGTERLWAAEAAVCGCGVPLPASDAQDLQTNCCSLCLHEMKRLLQACSRMHADFTH